MTDQTQATTVPTLSEVEEMVRVIDELDAKRTEGYGNVARHTMERLDSFVRAVAGKRLTYKALIA